MSKRKKNEQEVPRNSALPEGRIDGLEKEKNTDSSKIEQR